MGFNALYPLVMTNVAIENGPVEIVDFPIKNGGSFHCKMLVYQRVLCNMSSVQNPVSSLADPGISWFVS